MTAIQTTQIAGWAEYNTEGIATLYLTVTDEPFTTQPTDTPANTQFTAAIKNAMDFSIKRAPTSWIWGQAGVQGAAFGSLQLDNFNGQYQNLLTADLRDAIVVIAFPPAASLMPATGITNAMIVCTAVVDTITADDEDTVTINLKDKLANLDRMMGARFFPPYVEAAAANTMVPQLYGACRNVSPPLINSAQNIYQLNDAPITNLTSVTDKAAPLDPNASPPQFTPALSTFGVQLNAAPVGSLHIDASSVGTQAVIPGALDVFNGSGAFPGTSGSGAWHGAIGGTSGVVTTSAVTPLGGRYQIPVTAGTGTLFTVGATAFVSDGVNSIYGTIFSNAASVFTITSGTAVTTGTPASIATGSPAILPGAPDGGYTWTGPTGTIREDAAANNTNFGTNNAVVLTNSTIAFSPANSLYGMQFVTPSIFLPGRSYRISFALYNVQTQPPGTLGGFGGGLMLAFALNSNASSYITGINNPIQVGALKAQQFIFEFTMPNGTAAAPIYFIAAPPASTNPAVVQGPVSLEIYNLKAELLGTYTQLPLAGIPLDQYYNELLVIRGGEAAGVFNTADFAALALRSAALYGAAGDGGLMPMGMYFEAQANLLDALRMPVDTLGGVIFTDNLGAVRGRLIPDPSNPIGRTVKANFDATNVAFNIVTSDDAPTGLTTLWGCRRNWDPFSSVSDFVTDTAIVSKDTQARYMRTSQFEITSSKTPAGYYNIAIGAPIFDTVFDLASDCQLNADRIVGIWSPQVYSDGTSTNGKRTDIVFTAYFDDPTALGATITCAVNALMFGDIIQLTYPAKGISGLYCAVKEWEIFPFAKKIIIKGMA